MEADQNHTNTNLLPLALALLAIVLGGAGLYFGLTANNTLQPIVESMDASESSLSESAEEVASLKKAVQALSGQNKDLEGALSRLRAYGNERDKRLKELTLELNKQGERLANQAASVTTPAATKPAAVGTGAIAEGGYVIKSGDTFARIATEAGVPLQALLDANPGVDPRRLRIGQSIIIPAQ